MRRITGSGRFAEGQRRQVRADAGRRRAAAPAAGCCARWAGPPTRCVLRGICAGSGCVAREKMFVHRRSDALVRSARAGRGCSASAD